MFMIGKKSTLISIPTFTPSISTSIKNQMAFGPIQKGQHPTSTLILCVNRTTVDDLTISNNSGYFKILDRISGFQTFHGNSCIIMIGMIIRSLEKYLTKLPIAIQQLPQILHYFQSIKNYREWKGI